MGINNYPRNMIAYRLRVKAVVLTHYGYNGQLQCSEPGCSITDIDMLTLDHINNDGAEDRKVFKTSRQFLSSLKRANYPPGYQTLCWNHNWKKEAVRRRQAVELKMSA